MLTDYIFIAHYPLLSEMNLEQMETFLEKFHALKVIFIENCSHKKDFRIPKLHSLVHYIENSYQLRVPDNFLTETPESLHISMCKEPYRASNHHDFDSQILGYLDIHDRLSLQNLYKADRLQVLVSYHIFL